MRFSGKVVIVTGGGRGIGKACSLMFAKEGANVVITYNTNRQKAMETAKEINELGKHPLVVKTDVRSSFEIDRMINETLDKFGKIDVLVNNAGIVTQRCVIDLPENEWDLIMDVNAKGVFLCSQAVAKQLIKQGHGGKIISIASCAGKTGAKFLAHYCASKAAVILFTQSLALELAPYKINVNAVCPGIIYGTDMQEQLLISESKLRGISKEEMLKLKISWIPLGRLGTPEEVAKVVLFLASEDADYLTGQTINVSGGCELH
ncbi:MAG: SDR family NAD(P)-dependent oxidoreductase [Candidatus Heimdallarchaeaceae archaeon]